MSSSELNNFNSIYRYYKSRINILDILETAGYDTSIYKGFDMTDVHCRFLNNEMDMVIEKSTSTDSKSDTRAPRVLVKYLLPEDSKWRAMEQIVHRIFDEQILDTKKNDAAILILTDEMNDSNKKTVYLNLKQLYEKWGIYVVVTTLDRLQFNILNHQLVPKHTVLSSEQTDELKRKYGIKEIETEIPEISRFDPVAQMILLRPGQVCEIIRDSKSAGQSLYYRVCV